MTRVTAELTHKNVYSAGSASMLVVGRVQLSVLVADRRADEDLGPFLCGHLGSDRTSRTVHAGLCAVNGEWGGGG